MSNPNAETVWFPAAGDALARHFGPRPARVHARFAALSHPGHVRVNNEDRYAVIERQRARIVLLTNLPDGTLAPDDDTAYLLAVADGVGGAAFGDLASMLALRSGWEQAPTAIKWTWVVTESEVAALRDRVGLVFQRIHEDLLARGREDPACAGMSTTLTTAYTVGPDAFVAHVGHSRAYLFHAGVLTRLTRDHTLAGDARAAGMPVPSRSWHRTLTNSLGGPGQSVRVESHHFRLAADDQLLLCTDGLTALVPDDDIAAVLRGGAPPREAIEALVELALSRGGNDNVTAVIGRYEM